jgi:hypothetical protein
MSNTGIIMAAWPHNAVPEGKKINKSKVSLSARTN